MWRPVVLCLALSASLAAVAQCGPLDGRAAEKRARFASLQTLISESKRDGTGQIASQVFRAEALILASDRDPVDVLLRRTAALLAHLKTVHLEAAHLKTGHLKTGHLKTGHLKTVSGVPDLSAEQARLEKLGRQAAEIDVGSGKARYELFEQLLQLRRQIAFANPLLDFDRILFIKRHFLPGSHPEGNHMCDQYFGFHAIAGGGLFVLEDALGRAGGPTVRDVLADSICENGRFQGKRLPTGGLLSPELSYDGKTILFAFSEAEPTLYEWTERSTFHVFKVNVDGSGLVQLTFGPTNDFDPCWLPDGRIAFISERRGGYGRCHARPVPVFTLHTMNGDGSEIVCISAGESNEWHPSVDRNGMIVYTRWDYMDRGHSQAHHPWITAPDGRDARAIQGNFGSSMRSRPFMEMDVRAIPGSHRYVATAAAHHSQAYGSLVLLDPRIRDDDATAPLRRLTPEVPFPEAECNSRTGQVYAAAWPLSEDFYLCVYDARADGTRGPKNNYGIYLLDSFGNKELIYRDPAISCLSPIPLRPRRRPPIVPRLAAVGKPRRAGSEDLAEQPQTAPVSVINVVDGLKPWPDGTTIKALRIVQALPKTTPHHHQPRIGYGLEKSARAVLGTVPVEPDGSAHFSLPVGKPVFFQALDERGIAVQSMRSVTYAHPGQQLVCQGCHEPRHRAPSLRRQFPLALRREPSKIRPEADGSNPFSYPRLVQPVLQRHCVSCHAEEPKAMDLGQGDVAVNRDRWYTSYINLRDYAFYFGKYDAEYDAWTDPRTTPGKFGARASKLLAVLDGGHYDVKLSEGELRRITLWLDCNSDFFGSYENTEAQARGEVVQPTLQ